MDKETLFTLFVGREYSLNFLRHPFKLSGPELLEAEILGAAYALEMYGFRNEAFEEIEVSSFLENLRNSGRPYYHVQRLERLISEALENEHADLIVSLLLFLGFGLFLLVVWGWSLSYFFRATHGAWYLRIIKMIAIALVFWPLSFLVFWLMKKSEPNLELTHSLNIPS